tara:strand:- start:275 stop:745 length:471 start_codon:yes stop_codon:yes gene_type:complete
MIQIDQQNSFIPQGHNIYLDIYDQMTNTDYDPLFAFTSQLSKKTLYCNSTFTYYGFKERSVWLSVFTVSGGTSAPENGIIKMGTTDYPYGFYDTTVYQNTSDTNLDPDGLTVLWTGLMNLRTDYDYTGSTPNPAVEYTEYSANDTDIENVYITFNQ